ncbi:restriction endonuclease [Pseudodesulfovibrio sp. F-1]|uniref:Restriction endonuclease n=1 Tax=Pseudodesulfovibrio alkaliphilus TaxID=2661613 RepID=A0A7K1KMU5_9BACT|nr:restriction endonuclease [Pseudodesulfovibrio alkaliphilus]MUM77370.1 restriction endonuclease [Pseudodesulfovibrio alkaliphilus]
MAIPDFQTLILPVLEFLQDGNSRSNQEIFEAISKVFVLTDEERRRLLPSGKQRVFNNRVAWGKSYLKQAGLIESKQRGWYGITQRGIDVLSRKPDKLTIKDLMAFPEFRKFREGSGNSDGGEASSGMSCDAKTPQDHMEYGLHLASKDLTSELIARIRECPPRFFERLVVDLLLAMGYGESLHEAATLTGNGADEGIDGIINEDKLGLDVVYVQAKRWAKTVGRPEIQQFAGALHGKKARKGVFITLSDFSREALEYVGNIDTRIVLISGSRLAELMVKYNVGVEIAQVYELKKINLDYFIEE